MADAATTLRAINRAWGQLTDRDDGPVPSVREVCDLARVLLRADDDAARSSTPA